VLDHNRRRAAIEDRRRDARFPWLAVAAGAVLA